MRHILATTLTLLLCGGTAKADGNMRIPAEQNAFEAGMRAYAQGKTMEAMELWRPLALSGDGFVQGLFGTTYQIGKGVPQDSISAHLWHNLACASGYRASCNHRDKISAKMTNADISEAQRRARVCLESNYKDCD